jgi:beta-phosphoglucomutase-like phosphatase (HAD superfamily)
MRLKALIFDVDGTLADTEEAHRRAFNEAFTRHGLDWNWSKPKYAELLRTTGGKERIGAFVGTLGLPDAARDALLGRVPEIHATKTDIYTRLVNEGQVPLRDGVVRLLGEAGSAGVPLAIATTTTFANIRALLETNLGPGALGRFSVIGAGDQVARKKPAPDIYHWVLGELKLGARHCVAFEDSGNGVAAAKAAGIFTVVTPSYWTRDEDFSAADLLLPTLGSDERPLTHHALALVGSPVLGLIEIDRQLKDNTNMHIAHQN